LGKSCLACALGHKACLEDISVRVPRLFADLAVAHDDAHYAKLLPQRLHQIADH
jgi:DNA replication protein DnaC